MPLGQGLPTLSVSHCSNLLCADSEGLLHGSGPLASRDEAGNVSKESLLGGLGADAHGGSGNNCAASDSGHGYR